MIKEFLYLVWLLFCFFVTFLVILISFATGFFKDIRDEIINNFIDFLSRCKESKN